MPALGLALGLPFSRKAGAAAVPSEPWITTPGTNSLRNDFTAWSGCKFTTTQALTITALGRIFISGNTQLHDVGIFDVLGNALLVVSVDCSAGIDGQFNYTSGSVSLSDATSYILACREFNAGDQLIQQTAQTVTGVATLVESAFRSGDTGVFVSFGGGVCFGPPNFKYAI